MTRRRVAVVTSEVLGVPGTGGPGTADSLLAVALGRRGYQVELLVAPGRDLSRLSRGWEQTYRDANVRLRPLPGGGSVQPSFLAPAAQVHEALRNDPPDVVVADDWRALAYAALRSRQLGSSLADTAFVVYCHGPARVFAEAARKVPDTLARFGEEVAQRACLELADAVVSPSEWLLGWLRDHDWRLAEPALVIQNIWQSEALEQPAETAAAGSRIRRLAFFGQLREGKGIRVLIAALRELEPRLLERLDLVFLGATRSWTEEQIGNELGPAVAGRLSSIRLETGLDRDAALAELRQPGTLAVMPSLLENSPYAVAECIEHGVPFLATNVGGTPELVAEEDRDRVLCAPTPADLAAALTDALESETGVAPVRPARAREVSLAAWLDLIETVAPRHPREVGAGAVTRVSVVAEGDASLDRAARLAETTHSVAVEVVRAESRGAGLQRASADWVVFLDQDDVPDDSLIDALVAAQAASGADVVTTAVRAGDGAQWTQLFLGDPGALGLVENQYGVIGLIRRSVAVADTDWPLFARLALAGAKIVSVPEPLGAHLTPPSTIGDSPAEGLAVLEAFETSQPQALQQLPQLAATLAAALARSDSAGPPDSGLHRRLQVIRRRLLR